TESTDFRPISEARFRVSHGTLTAYSFLYLLRATFYPAKLFWSEPPKPSFQGFGRELLPNGAAPSTWFSRLAF
ncbi:hypothetical protein, partial [Microcystis aeruginosa]|uniref:hypothetical protein n=1 Tax=Microcystis aeruginosa TaxID=1126 RepID=UPI00232B8EA3